MTGWVLSSKYHVPNGFKPIKVSLFNSFHIVSCSDNDHTDICYDLLLTTDNI